MRRWLTVPLVLAPLLLARCAPAPPPFAICCAMMPLESTVYFARGGVELNARSQRVIRDAAEHLMRRTESRMAVIGNTDQSGGPEANPRLSRRRAEVVAAALVKLNVPRERLDVLADGDANPLVPTARGQKEPQNRRVDLSEEIPGISRVIDPSRIIAPP